MSKFEKFAGPWNGASEGVVENVYLWKYGCASIANALPLFSCTLVESSIFCFLAFDGSCRSARRASERAH
jgi:hypothetical protein